MGTRPGTLAHIGFGTGNLVSAGLVGLGVLWAPHPLLGH